MSRPAIELSYAIRFSAVGRYLGQLCLVLAVLTLVPLAVSAATGQAGIAWRYAIVAASLSVAGWSLSRLPAPQRVQANEAMVLVVTTFVVAPLVMTFPMMGAGLDFVDALFETVSAATTTGLSTLATVEDKPLSFLFARSWMQWYGGLGIVVLSLALVLRPGVTTKCLAVTEEVSNDLVGGTRAHARRVLVIYGLLTVGAILALTVAGSGPFNAVVYAFSAVSTGGFAPHDASLGHFQGWSVPWLVSVACLAGSLPLALYHHSWRRGWRVLRDDLQLRTLLALSVTVSAALVACMYFVLGAPWQQSLFHGPLLVVSSQSTAGFSTMAIAGLDPASKLVLILSMAIGGGVGSTAGGIKVLRLVILLRLLHTTLVRTCLPPHAVLNHRLSGQRLHDEEVRQALLLILVFVAVVVASWLPFLVLGYDPLDSLFEVVSATGTVGLSAGVTGPELPTLLKGVLCVDMLLGRLEILACLVLFYPRTWFGRRNG